MNTAGSVNPEQFRAGLARVERLARLTDTGMRIPFTRIRFGIDPLLGLIPVVGDFIGLALSLYIYQQARELAAPDWLRRRMIRNMGIDLVGGFVPVVGDVFDVAWRANSLNAQLLLDWGREVSAPEAGKASLPQGRWWLLVFVLALGALIWLFRPTGIG